jgi:hypothetical protein
MPNEPFSCESRRSNACAGAKSTYIDELDRARFHGYFQVYDDRIVSPRREADNHQRDAEDDSEDAKPVIDDDHVKQAQGDEIADCCVGACPRHSRGHIGLALGDTER